MIRWEDIFSDKRLIHYKIMHMKLGEENKL